MREKSLRSADEPLLAAAAAAVAAELAAPPPEPIGVRLVTSPAHGSRLCWLRVRLQQLPSRCLIIIIVILQSGKLGKQIEQEKALCVLYVHANLLDHACALCYQIARGIGNTGDMGKKRDNNRKGLLLLAAAAELAADDDWRSFRAPAPLLELSVSCM